MDTQTATLARSSITKFSKNKRLSIFFFARANKIPGSTMQPLQNFKTRWTYLNPQELGEIKFTNVIGPFEEKKNQKNWNVVIGQASSKCPGLSVSTVSSVLIKIKEERETVWKNKGFKRCIRDFVRCELHYVRTCGQDITNSGTRGGNHSVAISTRFACGERQYICVSIPSFKLLQVELVRVFFTSNLGQNLLVVVITQCRLNFW